MFSFSSGAKASAAPSVAGGGMSLNDLPVPKLIRENYVLVPKVGADQKEQSPPTDSTRGDPVTSVEKKASALLRIGAARMAQLKRAVVTPVASKAGKGMHRVPVYRCDVVRDFGTTTSSANTALSTVVNLRPSDSDELAYFSDLFTEARCTGITFYTATGMANVTSTSDVGACAGFVFDPANSAAFSAMKDMLVAEHSCGPVLVGNMPTTSGGAPTVSSPLVATKTGFGKWGTRLAPSPTLVPGVTVEAVAGSWFGLADTSIIVGYFKPFIEAAGSGNSTWYRNLCVFHMEFRTRA